MKLNLHEDQLKGLINHAKTEVFDQEKVQIAMAEMMNTMFNNDMNLHRVMLQTLNGAHQIQLTQSTNNILAAKKITIGAAFKCEDDLTLEVFKVLKKHAMYFGCFSRHMNNFPDMVLEEAKELLKVQTDTVTFNDMDLRFNSIVILMDLLDKKEFEHTCNAVTVKAETAMNGSQPYIKITLTDNSLPYEGNKFEIQKTCYYYNLKYTYLDLEIKSNHTLDDGHGNYPMDLPVGVMYLLNASVNQLCREVVGDLSMNSVLEQEKNKIVQILKETIDTCLTKFVDTGEKELSLEERMRSIARYINERVRYNMEWKSGTVSLTGLKGENFSIFTDNEEIVYEIDLPTYVKVDSHYEKSTVKFYFTHLEKNNLVELITDKDDLPKIQDLWFLRAIYKDLQSVAYTARELTLLLKNGYHN